MPAGKAVPLYYASTATSWRGAAEDGVPHLMDAFCPRLAATGYGLGDDGEHGGNVGGLHPGLPAPQLGVRRRRQRRRHPYTDRLNKRAKVRSYPVVERNGAMFAWYHPTDEAPGEIPEVPELNDHPSSPGPTASTSG